MKTAVCLGLGAQHSFLFPQSFGHGDVMEVKGLAVAVPEGVVVELKQPQGGFVFQRHGSRTLLEEVEALKVRYGQVAR